MNHVGREQSVTALGRTWRISRWTRSVWADYLAWARTQLPDPVEVALRYIDSVKSDQLRDVVVCHALEMRNQYLAISSPEVQRLLGSLEGISYLLYLLLRKYQPDVTPDDAWDVALEMGEEALRQATEQAQGRVEGASPNSQGPAAPTCPSAPGQSPGTRSTGSSPASTPSAPPQQPN